MNSTLKHNKSEIKMISKVIDMTDLCSVLNSIKC